MPWRWQKGRGLLAPRRSRACLRAVRLVLPSQAHQALLLLGMLLGLLLLLLLQLLPQQLLLDAVQGLDVGQGARHHQGVGRRHVGLLELQGRQGGTERGRQA
jgi:hypothetical protein